MDRLGALENTYGAEGSVDRGALCEALSELSIAELISLSGDTGYAGVYLRIAGRFPLHPC
jgi:hypothetical protein